MQRTKPETCCSRASAKVDWKGTCECTYISYCAQADNVGRTLPDPISPTRMRTTNRSEAPISVLMLRPATLSKFKLTNIAPVN